MGVCSVSPNWEILKTSNIDYVKTSWRWHLTEKIGFLRFCQIWKRNLCKILENNGSWEVHEIRKCNENGERLVVFCSSHNLVIGVNQFRYKDIHKLERKYNDVHRTTNQIEYLMINKKWRGSMKFTRVYIDSCVLSHNKLLFKLS